MELNKERLQKVTVFEDREAIDQALQSNTDSYYDVVNYLLEKFRYSSGIVSGLLRFDETPEEIREAGVEMDKYLHLIDYTINRLQNYNNVDSTFLETARSWTFTCNSYAIQKVYLSEVQRGYLPSVSDMAAITGLSRKTVHKHLKSIKENEELRSRIEGSQVLIPKILAKLFNLGMEGNVKALQLLLEYHKEPERTISQRNYIQVNNLTITEEDILSLPTEKVLQIQDILKHSKT